LVGPSTLVEIKVVLCPDTRDFFAWYAWRKKVGKRFFEAV
jgi:hypothetical protein